MTAMTASSIYRRLPAWVLPLVVAALLGGCAKTDTEYLESAKRRHAAGDLAGAIIEAKNALAQNASNAQARLLLGTLHNETGNPKEAEPELRRALEGGLVEGGRVHAQLARALIDVRDYKKVLAEIKASDSFEPEPLAVIHALRGQAFLQARDKDSARESLEASAQSSPNHIQTALLQARILVSDAKPAEALAVVDDVLKTRPKSVEALMLRADLLHLLKRNSEVAAAYDAILSVRSGIVPVHVARAVLLIHQGKLDDARKDIDAIRKLSARIPAGHYLRALVLSKQGKLSEAESAIQEALKILPDYPAAQLLAGVIAYSRGAHASAEQILAKYFSRRPSDLTARKLLAATQIGLRKHREAFETLEPVLTEGMRDEVILGLAGDALLLGGDLDRASRYYERAVAVKPEDARLRTSLAVAQLQRGETEQALAELEAAAKLATGGDRADYILITTLYRRGEHDKALEAVRKLEAKNPKSPLPHNLAGAIHMARKDTVAARKSFERALELDPKYFAAAANLSDLDLKENRIADAQRRIEQFLAKNPKHLQAMLALSELASRAKDPAATVKWLEKARDAHPSAMDPLGRLSAHYLANGNNAKGLEYAQQAASRNPSVPAAFDILGTAQMANREFNAAAQTYVRLIRLTPAQPIAHYRLAAAQQAGGDLSGAEATLRKALELDPKYLQAWIALAGLQISQGRTDQALKTAAVVRRLAPKSPDSLALEGEALLKAKRHAEAVKAWEGAFALDPSGINAAKVYVARTRAGNRPAAVAGLEKWVEANPSDPMTRLMLADAYLADDRAKDAIGHYEKLLQVAPKDALVLNNLAMSYLAVKDPRAVDIARRAHEVAANDPNVLDTYGWILVEHGKVKDGLPLLEKAKSLKPKSDEISYHLAVALARSGDKARARKEIEALLALKGTPYAAQARALLNTL